MLRDAMETAIENRQLVIMKRIHVYHLDMALRASATVDGKRQFRPVGPV
jgi:hypothetical protein